MTMTQRVEHRRFSGIPDSLRSVPEPPAPPPAPSVSAALEKLASATQRVVSKRIDLVTLESHELLSVLISKSALIAFGVVVGLAAWFAAVSALALFLLPVAGPIPRLVIFAAINAAVAAVVVAFGLREPLPVLGGEVGQEISEEISEEHPVRSDVERRSARG
jgi:uncharacterized membrane protein YqjE